MRKPLQPHPNEPTGLLLMRVYRRIRAIDPSHKPTSCAVARVKRKQAQKRLRLVK
jgi:hypothetical protein